MTAKRALYAVLILGLLVGFTQHAPAVGASSAEASTAPAPARMESAGDEHAQGQPVLPEGVSSDWWVQAQAYIQQSEYEITWQEGTSMPYLPVAYQAPNRAHGLRTYFTPQGIRLIPRIETAPPWQLGISVAGYGDPGTLQPPDEADLFPSVARMDYHREGLAEWYLNTEAGLEQGFTLQPLPSSSFYLDLALEGDLTPALALVGRGVEFSTLDGKMVLVYGGFQAVDAAGRLLPVELNLFSTGVPGEWTLRLALPPFTQPVTLTARINSPLGATVLPESLPITPDWTYKGAQASENLGVSVGAAGDVNGDGYGDIIAGAWGFDSDGKNNRGKVYVWYGDVGGLGEDQKVPDWSMVGEESEDLFGCSVGTAGDVNGDGYSDVIIGAKFYDNGFLNEGAVYVWHGSEAGLEASYAWKAEGNGDGIELGFSAGTAGDVNGDGFDDIIAGAPYYDNGHTDEGAVFVWKGLSDGLCQDEGVACAPDSSIESDQAGLLFGSSGGTAGDVNGDGYSDILIGSSHLDYPEAQPGKVFIWYGDEDWFDESPGNPDWDMESPSGADNFGHSVSTAGDVNGDGYSDIVIGANAHSVDQSWEGAIYVFYGGESGMQSEHWMFNSNQIYTQLGYSVSAAGDVNGDGYADILAGAAYYDAPQNNEGAVFIWYGSADGMGESDNPRSPDWIYESDRVDVLFGYSVSTAGDLNGDGYSDVLIGAPLYDVFIWADAGNGFVYHGSPGGLSASGPNWIEGEQSDAKMGYSLDSAGDIKGDGYADIIVGAPYYDSGFAGAGRVYVFEGSEDGLATDPAWIADGDQLEAFFGWSVGTAGDVNGDGYGDVIVGAPYYDLGQVNEGAAFVWTSSSQGLGPDATAADADWSVEGDQLSAYFGWAVGTAGDVNGDGYSEVIVGAPGYDKGLDDEGRVFLYHGSAAGLSPDANWSDEGNQVEAGLGNAVGTAGDVDGDGYADVIVGADQYDNGQVNEGFAYVYYGSEGGLSSLPGWKAESDQANARFGCAASSAGDVNGDGYADVLIGACRYDEHPLKVDEGAAFVWHGSADGLGVDGNPGNYDWMAAGDQKNAQFGFSVDLAGDVNGDGFADIIIGAPYYDSGPLNDGRVFVYHGSQEGLSPTARWNGQGGDIGDVQFGYAVSAAGDVNGDGYADVIVGAPSFDHVDDVNPTVPDVGLLSLYFGNGRNALPLRPRQLQPDGSPLAHLGVSDSETEVQLSLLGRSPHGRDLVRMEWQIAPLGTPFTDTSVISGSTSNWTDTGIDGAFILQTITGLEPGAEYHWRLRLIYHPSSRLGVPASRWIHMPWDGWEEQDFRTSAEEPEPPEQPMTFLPLISR